MPHLSTTGKAKEWEKNLIYAGLLIFTLALVMVLFYSISDKDEPSPAPPVFSTQGRRCFTLKAAGKGNFASATETYRVKRAGRINMYSRDEYWFIDNKGLWIEQQEECEFIIVTKNEIGGPVFLAGKKKGTIVCFEEGDHCR